MRFIETPLSGVFVVRVEPAEDLRGSFSRTFCEREFSNRGLEAKFVQCSTSFNRHRGTLRGLHFQTAPNQETKLVRCTRGRIFDVAVDLRRGSATFGKWYSEELTADNRTALYIPKGFAHGFQTLEDASEVFYQISHFYEAESAGGLRWNDPDLKVAWPLDPGNLISDRDKEFGGLAEIAARGPLA